MHRLLLVYLLVLSLLLPTVYVPENSTTLSIGNVIDEWGLAGKVSFIFTDDGVNIVKAVNEINMGHISCLVHTFI